MHEWLIWEQGCGCEGNKCGCRWPHGPRTTAERASGVERAQYERTMCKLNYGLMDEVRARLKSDVWDRLTNLFRLCNVLSVECTPSSSFFLSLTPLFLLNAGSPFPCTCTTPFFIQQNSTSFVFFQLRQPYRPSSETEQGECPSSLGRSIPVHPSSLRQMSPSPRPRLRLSLSWLPRRLHSSQTMREFVYTYSFNRSYQLPVCLKYNCPERSPSAPSATSAAKSWPSHKCCSSHFASLPATAPTAAPATTSTTSCIPLVRPPPPPTPSPSRAKAWRGTSDFSFASSISSLRPRASRNCYC